MYKENLHTKEPKFGNMKITHFVACVARVSVRFSARSRHFLFFSRAKIGASAKKCVTGEGKGEKEALARKPHDFEKPVRPRTEFPDWHGMVALIAN